MAIRFACANPLCGKPLAVPDGAEGEQVTCRCCGVTQIVPAGTEPARTVPAGAGDEKDPEPRPATQGEPDPFFVQCLGSIRYGVRSFPSCFRLALLVLVLDLALGFVQIWLDPAVVAMRVGLWFAVGLWLAGNLVLGAVLLRFFLKAASSSLDGSDLPPAMPPANSRDLVRTGLLGLGMVLVYVLPVVTIPLLPMGWLALSRTHDARAFDLGWALKAAGGRLQRLLQVWLVVLVFAVVGLVAVPALAVMGWTAAAALLSGSRAPHDLVKIAWFALSIPFVALVVATAIVSACAHFRCVGVLGRFCPDVLRHLPKRPDMARTAACFSLAAVLSMLSVFYIVPPAARGTGRALARLIRATAPTFFDRPSDDGGLGGGGGWFASGDRRRTSPTGGSHRPADGPAEAARRLAATRRREFEQAAESIRTMIGKAQFHAAERSLGELADSVERAGNVDPLQRGTVTGLRKSLASARQTFREELAKEIPLLRRAVDDACDPVGVVEGRLQIERKADDLKAAADRLERVDLRYPRSEMIPEQARAVAKEADRLAERTRQWPALSQRIEEVRRLMRRRPFRTVQVRQKLEQLARAFPREVPAVTALRSLAADTRRRVELAKHIKDVHTLITAGKLDQAWAALDGLPDVAATMDSGTRDALTSLKREAFRAAINAGRKAVADAEARRADRPGGRADPHVYHAAIQQIARAAQRDETGVSAPTMVGVLTECRAGLMAAHAPSAWVREATALIASLAKKAGVEAPPAVDYVSLTWPVPRWQKLQDKSLQVKHPLRSNCCLQFQYPVGAETAFVGAEISHTQAVTSRTDKAYLAFRDAHFKAFADSLKADNEVLTPSITAQKVDGREYDVILALRGRRVKRVMVTILDGRAVAFWYYGHLNGYTPFRKAMANAKVE